MFVKVNASNDARGQYYQRGEHDTHISTAAPPGPGTDCNQCGRIDPNGKVSFILFLLHLRKKLKEILKTTKIENLVSYIVWGKECAANGI